MRPIFLSVDARRRESWLAAFPALIAAPLDRLPAGPALIAAPLDRLPAGPALVWALRPPGQPADAVVQRLRTALGERPLVVLADDPTQDDAMAALAAGAVGYCNGHAAPPVLKQVATVVENGGIWVGQGLMQRLLTATARVVPPVDGAEAVWRSTLTAREQEAAILLAKGASNKEIARQLDITERTVKSHVSAMLEKLGVRDRLQLSLIINGVGA